MKHGVWSLIACGVFSLVQAAGAETYPAAGTGTSLLTIYSTTDTAVFEGAIRHFQKLNPGITVRYEELESNTLYEQFLADLQQGKPRADLLLSAAMDLQVKLVNDGYAATHISANARMLPVWARWRDQAFGFTFEPAVMVFNVRAFAGRRLPQTRGELIDLVRRDPSIWRGRIGTYDIAGSSVGHCRCATQRGWAGHTPSRTTTRPSCRSTSVAGTPSSGHTSMPATAAARAGASRAVAGSVAAWANWSLKTSMRRRSISASLATTSTRARRKG